MTRELEVKVKRDALRARGLGILDVVDAVRESNLLLPSGHLKAGDARLQRLREHAGRPRRGRSAT